MATVRYPALYEINTRVWLGELSHKLGRPATLDDVPVDELERIRRLGFDWVWLLGIWQIGPAGRQVSLTQADWRRGYEEALPDFSSDDVSGSPFAVQAYIVDRSLGGDDALARFRERLAQRELNLMLDFVPNHTALDHPWVKEHPEYYIQGDAADLQREPRNYIRLDTHRGPIVFAYGRDPYFPGWPDTLQLNYRYDELREQRIEEMIRIAGQCDGLRCDMAMLLLPDIIQKTWGDKSLPRDGNPAMDEPFWPEAIAALRREYPAFLLMAEVYWDLEFVLQQQGFDYTYDKRLYDRLRDQNATTVRGHLHADLDFQRHSARFLENHDEPRAAATFPPGVHQAAAVITYLVPGLRFFHEGQLEGRRVHVSMHLNRRPQEPPDPVLVDFYRRLLATLQEEEVRNGRWQLLECQPAWDGNPSWEHFIAFAWDGGSEGRQLVVVNYGPTRGQCLVQLPFDWLRDRKFLLRDLMSPVRYDRDGNDLLTKGLYLDEAEWAYHVFEMMGTV
jgi:glycosidase